MNSSGVLGCPQAGRTHGGIVEPRDADEHHVVAARLTSCGPHRHWPPRPLTPVPSMKSQWPRAPQAGVRHEPLPMLAQIGTAAQGAFND
ncbi:MAG: hypothetical protein ACLTMP_14185 [Eggerthella lenta]